MPWTKRNSNTWDYKSGDYWGYIVFLKYYSGKEEYQGLIANNKTKKISTCKAASLTACKNMLMRRAKIVGPKTNAKKAKTKKAKPKRK